MHRLPFALTLIIGCTLTAQATKPVASLFEQPPTLEVPFASHPPALTADLDDPAWKVAASLEELTPSVRQDESPSGLQPTRVLLMWDEANLYVRFICQDDDIRSAFTKRDEPLYKADVVEVFLDAVGDGRQYIELQVSPNNVVFDQNITITAELASKADGVLESRVIDRDLWLDLGHTMEGLRTATMRIELPNGNAGWVVDMAIPAKAALRRLGIERFKPMTLRANLLRYDYVGSELHAGNWSPVRYGCPHISPSRMGHLRLVRSASP